MAEFADIAVIDCENPGESSPYEFDSITLQGGNTLVPDSGLVLHGTQSYKIVFDGVSGWAWGDKNFTANDLVYIRKYFYLPLANFPYKTHSTDRIWNLLQIMYGASTYLLLARLKTGGTSNCTFNQVVWQDSAGPHTETLGVPVPVSLDAPHYMELVRYRHASAGYVRIFLDGEMKWEKTALNTSAYQNEKARAGFGNTVGFYPNSGQTFTFDDFLISTTGPIGEYSSKESSLRARLRRYIAGGPF